MLAGSRQLIWTLFLLFVGDVFSNSCFLTYTQQLLCAVRGSSVVFFCYFNVEKQEVKKLIWLKGRSSKMRFILRFPGKFPKRFEYIGNKEHNCSMKIHKVEQDDAGKYFFTYNANKACSKPLLLRVIDLSILVQNAKGEAVREGDSVSLTCINGCQGDDASSFYTWFKDGEAINEGAVLHLTNLTSEHSGKYTCSLKSEKETTSGVTHVDVEYGPKNTSVLVGPSSEAGADGSIVLICHSDAHPPVQNYTWFKIVGGQTLIVGHKAEMNPHQDGQYSCSVSNTHGSQDSTVFTLKMKSHWTTFMRDILVIFTIAALLVVTATIAICRLTRNKSRTRETEHLEETQRIGGVNGLACEHYHQSQAVKDKIVEETTEEVIYTSIDFQKRRNSNTRRQDYQCETVIYSTVSRKQFLNCPNRTCS